MSIPARIVEDMKLAMKSGDKTRLDTLRTLRAAFLEREIEVRGSGGMTADDEVAVLMNAAKKRKESIEIFEKGKREDLVQQEQEELRIIQEYLPTMFSAEEVEKIVAEIVETIGASSPTDFGKVMGVVMKRLKGKADGRLIQDTVKRRLGA
jgi:hypothetical protein